MLGSLLPARKSVTIAGAGAAGLLAGYHLLQCGFRVTVREASGRPGGLIRSRFTEHGLSESAAHSFRSSPAMDALCQSLGLPLVTAKTKKKFILRHGRMRRFPLGLAETAALFFRLMTRRGLEGAPDMAAWGRHHLGDAAAGALITPLVRGIYGADPQDVRQDMAFPALTIPSGKTALQHFLGRSGPKAKSIMSAPEAGMEALITALANAIEAHERGEILYGLPCDAPPEDENVILAAPAPTAAKLLRPAAPRTAAALDKITYLPLAAATVFVRSLKPIEGIGVLAAEGEALSASGVLFNSPAFEKRAAAGLYSLTFIFAGTGGKEAASLSDAGFEAMIAQDLDRLFGKGVKMEAMVINRYFQGLPVYNDALAQALETAREDWCAAPGRILFGNYTGQISLRGLCESAARLAGEA